MKTKAFSLIEILIATIIFMTVVMVAVAAFAIIKRSNEITSDLAKTDECSRQIENFSGSIFRSASFGDPRVMAVVKNGENILLKNLDNYQDGETDAMGFAIFEKATVMGKIKLTIIFKKIDPDAKKTGYFYKSANVNALDAMDGMNLNNFLSVNIQKIHSSGCIPLQTEGESVEFWGKFDKPFHLKLSYPYEGGPASQIGKRIYLLTINDLIYSSFSSQEAEDKSISKLYVEVTNNIKAF